MSSPGASTSTAKAASRSRTTVATTPATTVTAATPTARPGDGADTKRRAQEIALDLFSRNGFDGTSMREIAEELGVTKAALYYHFTGKDEIARAILGDFTTEIDELLAWAARDPRPTPEELLRRWSQVMRTDGMRLMRFLQTNPRIAQAHRSAKGSLRDRMDPLFAALTPGDDSVEAQVRARLAVFTLQGAASFTAGLDASPEEVFDIALDAALDILPTH